MNTPIDFDGINRAALAVARSLLPDLIPGGKFRSLEYVVKNPCRDDRTAGSFSINYKTGLWKDFASQDGGSDIVSLVAYQRNCSQGDAAQELADKLGVPFHKLSGHIGALEPTPTARPTIVVATDAMAPAPKVYTRGDAGPPPRPGELRRHVYYSSSGVAMRVKIKLNDGGFVNWYRAFTNGVRSGWKPKKPDDYRAIPYASAAIDPFDPELCRDEILVAGGRKRR